MIYNLDPENFYKYAWLAEDEEIIYKVISLSVWSIWFNKQATEVWIMRYFKNKKGLLWEI